MTRLLLLVPFLAWMIWIGDPGQAAPSMGGAILFLSGYAFLVLALGLWARWLSRHIDSARLQRHLRRFNFTMMIARFVVAKWFVLGLFWFGWGHFVLRHSPILTRWPLTLPAALVATIPAYLAWMGLFWSQYPAERALREQSLLIQLENDLPINSPRRFASYFAVNVRLQVLFTVVPVMLILLLRDIAYVILWQAGAIVRDQSRAEPLILLAASATVFVFAPAILTLILHTQPLPDSPLRRRLEALCRDSKLRYRDILLWRTDNNLGNAAVMGLLPQLRYILLSDLLLETMTDEQVEAVFAHELGHIVHRHMAWYAILVVILMLAMSIIEVMLSDRLPKFFSRTDVDIAMNVAGLVVFFLVFGYLSRRFERQADVYAARTIEADRPTRDGLVGPRGANVFSSALYRVAVVNNIPIRARNFSHGSISARMNYLNDLAANPSLTGDFDRFMAGVYVVMSVALLVLGALAWVYRQKLLS